jgi:ergothioneine biosynthesis protein EgtB
MKSLIEKNSSRSRAGGTTAATLAQRYAAVRSLTEDLCRTLTPEDMAIQAMADVSPAKWHLAHTSWFFENFLLQPQAAGYRAFHPGYGFLFNSYYNTVGSMHPRPVRGLLSRPTVAEVLQYRRHVDEHMLRLLETRGSDAELAALVTLGLNHEQQHQELLLTDIKYLFGLNPLKPVWRELPQPPSPAAAPLKYLARPEGLMSIGHSGASFAFDNETPRHQVLLRPYKLALRPVSNGEFREFVRAGGYTTPELWLADGWNTLQREGWNRPLYWNEDMTAEFTLGGTRNLDVNAPVCHVSGYEADAYARWAGARLPTEAEWEGVARELPVTGNLMDHDLYQPAATADPSLTQMFGDVWEWTSSGYAPYPGFKPLAGSLGEYNGKFMANQWVLRGGSCVTPPEHVRATYRNFFYLHQRWQFTGLRLAQDA